MVNCSVLFCASARTMISSRAVRKIIFLRVGGQRSLCQISAKFSPIKRILSSSAEDSEYRFPLRLDSRCLARIEPVAHLVLVVAVQLAPQESGDVVRFHGVNGGAGEPVIDSLQVGLPGKYHIGGEFDLLQAPVVAQAELPDHRAVPLGELVQLAVDHLHREVVRQLLRPLKVGDPAEGVVQNSILDLALAQLPGQIAVAIAIHLEPERTPSRHAHVAQPQIRVDPIDVVVQAFAIVRFQVGLVRLFVMPRFVGAAGLHYRQNAHQSRLFPTLLQHLLDPLLLAKLLLASNKLDFHAVFGSDALHVFPNGVSQRLCPPGVVEDADLVLIKIVRHALGVAPLRKRLLDDDPAVAGEHTGDLALVPFCQEFDAHSGIITDILFGSGYAGLGKTPVRLSHSGYSPGFEGSDAAAICAISSSLGGASDTAASASRNIVLQNGQAAPTTLAPVATSSFARAWLTRSPFSSPRNASPPPAPQQKLRSLDRGGSITSPERAITARGSSYTPR